MGNEKQFELAGTRDILVGLNEYPTCNQFVRSLISVQIKLICGSS